MTSIRTKTVLLEASSVRYFREAASAGSIRRAAEALYVSPSALTRSIAQLEKLLGTKLLERRARGVTVTPSGALLLSFSQQSLFRINEMIGAIDDLQELRTGQVSIASVEGVATSLLSQCIVDFQQAHANVSISLSVLSSRAVVDAVLSGEVEIGVAFEPQKLRELRFVQAVVQPLCAVVRTDHPLARKRSVEIAEVVKHPLVLPNASFGLRQTFDRAIAGRRHQRDPRGRDQFDRGREDAGEGLADLRDHPPSLRRRARDPPQRAARRADQRIADGLHPRGAAGAQGQVPVAGRPPVPG